VAPGDPVTLRETARASLAYRKRTQPLHLPSAGCIFQNPAEEERLLVVPFKPDSDFHELWELDAATGEARRLTDPAITPFKIANGDWRVSPDGRHVAFVESKDRNIWVIELSS
jgi:Tol biopolymer transport system component